MKNSRNKQSICFKLHALPRSMMKSCHTLSSWAKSHPFVQSVPPTGHVVAAQLSGGLSLYISACVPVTLLLLNNNPQSPLQAPKGLSWWKGLRNSVKRWAMPWGVSQNRQIIVKSSDKMWSTGGGSGNPLQYSCLENPENSMKRQKDRKPEDEPPRLEDVQCYWERMEGNY